jgi:hypothetical protein
LTDPALALAFFDPERDIHGVARSGFTVLFREGKAGSLPEGARLTAEQGGWTAFIEGRIDLFLQPLGHVADLGPARSHICRASGTVDAAAIEGLGVVTETATPPRWDELDAVRNVVALFGPDEALLALARRPRGVPGHGDELVTGQVVSEGKVLAVEDARLSTVYDGDARPRTAGFEMWLPGEEFPRRAFGTAVAGVSLALEGVEAHVAVFSWRMGGVEGVGLYELTVRAPAPVAA